MADKIVHALISLDGTPIGHIILTNHGPIEKDPEHDNCEFELEFSPGKKEEFALALDELKSAITAALTPEVLNGI